MDRRKLRRLLASSSFAALLVAAEQVRGQDLTNPAGVTGTFLQVTAGDVFDDVINFGVLTGGGAPEVGIEVEGGGTVDGRVSNDGLIDIDNTRQATGIRMDGSGGFVGEGIHNHGLIDIFVSGTGTDLVARGIAVEGTDNVVLGGVDNDAGADMFLFVRAGSFNSGGASANASAGGRATGIFVGSDVTLSGGVTNAALIDVSVSNRASAFASNLNGASADANVKGSAFGVFLTAANLDGGFQNLNTGTIQASIVNGARALAIVGSGLVEADAGADAGAIGINVDSTTVTGGVQNDGALEAQSIVNAVATAIASGTGAGEAEAKADGSAFAAGVHVIAQFLGPDAAGIALENDGEVFSVDATAFGAAFARAFMTGAAEATAKAAALASVEGIHLKAATVLGDFENEGLVDVRAFAQVTADATASSTTAAALANATAQEGRAFAVGVLVAGDRLTGDFLNIDQVFVDATLSMRAFANATAPAGAAEANVAVVDASAFAAGVLLEMDTVVGDLRGEGVIDVRAVAFFGAQAAAAGSSAAALVELSELDVTAIGNHLEVDRLDGDSTNDADIQAHALARLLVKAAASVTGIGQAQATALLDQNDEINVEAYGLDHHIDRVFGSVTNSGDITVSGLIQAGSRGPDELGFFATATGGDFPVAVASWLEASISVTGFHAPFDIITGNLVNEGNVVALASLTAVVKAKAKDDQSTATATAAFEDLEIEAFGVLFEGDTLGGDMRNSGKVYATGIADIVVDAQGDGGNHDGNAQASVDEIDISAVALRMSADTVSGSVGNDGEVRAQALLLGGDSVRAVATGGEAKANAEWNEVNLTAIAYELDFDTVLGDIVNEGSLRAVAQASLAAFADANAGGSAGEADAKVDDIDILARGLDVEIDDFLLGNLVNNGNAYAAAVLNVEATASALSTGSSADADATVEDIELAATAMRVLADNDQLLGSVTNTGNLTAIGRINAQVSTVKAVASGTDATVEAHWEDILVDVNGLFLEAETLGGSFNNAGSVQAVATARIAALATAKGTDDADATASAETIALDVRGLNLEVETVGGDVVNEGSVSVQALLLAGGIDGGVRAAATGAAGEAEAQAEWDEVNLTAIAYEMDFETVFGDIVNDGSLKAVAQASLLAYALAKGDAQTGEADAKVDDVDILARGLDVEIDDFLLGNLVNNGNAYAAAILNVEATASALSKNDDADADATVEDIELAATAMRVLADNDQLLGSVTNNGNLTAIGRINFDPGAVKANANGDDATVEAHWEDISIDVNGLFLEAETLGGSFNNAGSVQAFATAGIAASATAIGNDDATATASAESIALDARGLNLEIETVGGSLVNEGSVTVQALLQGGVRAQALVKAGEAEAQAEWDEIELTAIAYEIDVETVFGDIVNEGSLRATAQASLAAFAFANGGAEAGEADARVDDVDILARGLDVEIDDFLLGNLVNGGNAYAAAILNVEATASALSKGSSADADATVEDIELQATALRVSADNDTIFGSVTNNGKLTALGRINAQVSTVKASAAGDDAIAEALWEDISIDVNGLFLEAESLGGSFNNSGAVEVFATAHIVALATASGPGTATATASAQSIALDARGLNLEVETVGGSVNNKGSVSVQALLQGGNSVQAVAAADKANAQAEWDDVSLTAIAYEMDFDTVFGDIVNDGALKAIAHASMAAFADANASGGAGEAAAKVDDVSILARGLDVEIDDVLFGNLVNSGDAYAAAILTVEVTASAVSSGGEADADATVEDIDLSAIALRVGADGDSILGSVTNSGNLTAIGLINVETSSVNAQAIGLTSASAQAHWDNVSIDVTGLFLDVEFLGGSFSNAGSVLALASAHLVATASARAAITADALAHAEDIVVSATGLNLEIETASGGISNSGQVVARADLRIRLNADAGVASAATATAGVFDVFAKAVGVRLQDVDTIGGGFANSAFVQVSAEIDVTAIALATDVAKATIEDANATAIGLWAEDPDTLSGGFVNNGDLLVDADVFAVAIALPSTATNIAKASAKASAFGLRMNGASTLNGGMLNTGYVQVDARAFAQASAPGGTASAKAWAKAYGMQLEIDRLSGDMLNEGTLNVGAFASAVAIGTATTASAQATAYGMFASITNVAFGSVINDGLIVVNVTANAPALAVGQGIVGGTFTGALVNATNGFHDIFASDPVKATALGLAIQNGAVAQGGIVNAGTVLAEAVSVGNPVARAIDVSGAGAGHRIQMLDGLLQAVVRVTAAASGEVGAAVYMNENGFADTLDWSGGLIEAHIFGEKTLDVMNVFAGKDDTFNHEHSIIGLLALNVNTAGQAATPVEFRIGGFVRNIADLNVNENGTLVVGVNPAVTLADITADQYTQDPDGRVLFELLPGNNNNGTIRVNSSANLTGIVGIRPLAGLYNDTQSYRVIDYVTRNGTFSGVQNTPLLQVEPTYNFDNVTLEVTRVPFDQVPGLTHNQNELSEALEDFYDPVALLGTEIGDEVVAELFALWTEDEYLDALDDLHGAEHAQMAYAGFQAMEFVLGGVNQRLHDGRSVSSGGGQSASLGNQSLQYAQIRSGDEGITGTQLAAVGNSADQPGSVWGKGFGSFGSLDGDKEAPGYDRTTGAIVVGVDYRIDEQFLIGLVGAYAFSSIDFDDGDDGDIDSWQIGLFGSWDSGTWYVDGLVSYAFQSYETTRHIDFIDEKAEGDYDGGAVQVYGELGYQFQVGQQGLITPLVGLGWTNVWTDDFTETGAGGANLRVDEARYESLATTLGVRGSLALDGWEPSLFLGWRHEFLDDHGEADVAFAAVPGSEWKVIGSDIGSDAGLVGVGLVAEISQQLEATIDYGGQFSGSGSNHTGSIGLRLKF